ncbi:carcinine hydrolase/isopenicillin-N N-acyltransferase family protein [Maribacter sp. HTCC2170]|uniref:carcinine hydrolase/isopenicillin-N N-acyltransferase family protein n=1 Tax=Maribacter sp. (strain HTCC2170 / KCCM 42371) TaxID=313603 RepID=UPI00006B474F|nr:linear amide C-N hydrolase [Maribacter sp. HTCC2170]EAR01943.1 hypothetical protein FB2170_15483 [Maribacter sp. HTCC2170]
MGAYMMSVKKILPVLFLFFGIGLGHACSIIYYIDKNTGKIYVANNEDYWYDVDAYIQLTPKTKNKYARLWYGWDDFAQGGVNEHGLFFDGAVTPEQEPIKGAKKAKGNLGDDILANCKTVEEAIILIRKRNVGLNDAHIMFGDSTGNAVVIEWVNGKEKLINIKENRLVMTNYLLSDPSKGNYPCPRFDAIEKELNMIETMNEPANMKKVGTAAARAVQSPFTNNEGRTGGTLYSSFINISEMKFILVPKLDNDKIIQLNLNEEFQNSKKKTIKLE